MVFPVSLLLLFKRFSTGGVTPPPYLSQLLGVCKVVDSDSQEDIQEGV